MFAVAKLADSATRVNPERPRQRETDLGGSAISHPGRPVGIHSSVPTSTIPILRQYHREEEHRPEEQVELEGVAVHRRVSRWSTRLSAGLETGVCRKNPLSRARLFLHADLDASFGIT